MMFGLGGAPAAQVSSTVRGIKEPGLDGTQDSGSAQDRTTISRIAHRTATRRRLNILEFDQREVQSLRPTRPLAEIAEEAWRKDKTWKDKALGLPAGHRVYGIGEKMLDVMLKDGIQVPVEVGDAVGMKL